VIKRNKKATPHTLPATLYAHTHAHTQDSELDHLPHKPMLTQLQSYPPTLINA